MDLMFFSAFSPIQSIFVIPSNLPLFPLHALHVSPPVPPLPPPENRRVVSPEKKIAIPEKKMLTRRH